MPSSLFRLAKSPVQIGLKITFVIDCRQYALVEI